MEGRVGRGRYMTNNLPVMPLVREMTRSCFQVNNIQKMIRQHTSEWITNCNCKSHNQIQRSHQHHNHNKSIIFWRTNYKLQLHLVRSINQLIFFNHKLWEQHSSVSITKTITVIVILKISIHLILYPKNNDCTLIN